MYFWQNLTHCYQFEQLSQNQYGNTLEFPPYCFSNPIPQWNSENFAQQINSLAFQEPIDHQNLENRPSNQHIQSHDIDKTPSSPCSQEKLSRNLKSTIARDFIKSLKRDTSNILIAKKVMGIDIPIKNFMEYLNKKVPDEGKYIRLRILQDLCFDRSRENFSKLFRVLLKSFLRDQYQICVLEKKKKRMECLKAARELELKLFRKRGEG